MSFHGGLFSESEIQRMASPERLDQLVQVTRPSHWIVLASSSIIILYILGWGVFGQLAITVKGEGILVNRGLMEVQAGATGRLLSYDVVVGKRVKKGERVARMTLSGVQDQLELKRGSLRDLEATQRDVVGLDEATKRQRSISLEEKLRRLSSEIPAAESVDRTRQDQYAQQYRAYQAGLVTHSAVAEAYNSVINAQRDVNRLRSEMDQSRAEQAQLEATTTEKKADYQNRINDLQRAVAQLEEQLANGGDIRSPEDGVVVELLSDKDHLLERNSRILLLEPDKEVMEAVVYVPAEEAKKIQHDLNGIPLLTIPARINPSTHKPEEFGSINGSVKTIGLFPATPDAMNKVLRNQSLVQKLAKDGATPIEIRTTLVRNEKTPTGFDWTSFPGPEGSIVSGTICTGTFEVDRKRPFEYVIPWVKRTLGQY